MSSQKPKRSSKSKQSKQYCSQSSDMERLETPAWVETLKSDLIDILEKKMSEFKDELRNEVNRALESSDIVQKIASNQKQINEQQVVTNIIQRRHRELNVRLQKLEAYSMRENVVVSGIPEQDGETEQNVLEKTRLLMSQQLELQDVDKINITRCHRMYQPMHTKYQNNTTNPHTRPRDIIVRFYSYTDKSRVMQAARNLKGTGIFLNDQYPREMESRRRILRPIMNHAKYLKKKASIVQDRLIIDGKTYDMDNLNQIPFDTAVIATKSSDTCLLFGGRLAIFSNFHTSTFTINGLSYSSVEQYYQREKAMAMNNANIATEIMMETDPGIIKRLGGSIVMNDDQLKQFKQLEVMEKGIWEKFCQNPSLRKSLLDTKDKELVECNPHDRYWGIGRGLRDPMATDKKEWRGANKLGSILMKVRDSL